jgi:hypothetical protein
VCGIFCKIVWQTSVHDQVKKFMNKMLLLSVLAGGALPLSLEAFKGAVMRWAGVSFSFK